MLAQLPKALQEKVIGLLQEKDFSAAKELHDAWLNEYTADKKKPPTSFSQHNKVATA